MDSIPLLGPIGYLAPDIPSLSATFVYEEMYALEAQGYHVESVSVHKPIQLAIGQEKLAARTFYLYDRPRVLIAWSGLIQLPSFGIGALKALRLLISDVISCGAFSPDARKLAFQYLVAVKLAIFLKKKSCAHLHVHFAHVPTQIAMYASAMSGVPFSIMAHANDIFERGVLLREKAERAAMMATISEFNRSYLMRIGVPPEKIEVVRCGVSFQVLPPARTFEEKRVYRLGTLGRLVEKKGVDVLIRAVSVLRDRPYSIELSIAGDGPLREDLEHLCSELGLTKSVRFTGSIAHSEVAGWMKGLDVLVLACKMDKNGDMDGIPVVLMEAMSQSIPVISTQISGIPELIVHGQTGLLATPGDAHDLANQIAVLIQSTDLRNRMVAAAVEHVENEFGQEVNIKRLVSIFSKDFHPAASQKTEIPQ